MTTHERCPRCGSTGHAIMLHPDLRVCDNQYCDLLWVAVPEDVSSALGPVPDEELSRLVAKRVMGWTQSYETPDIDEFDEEMRWVEDERLMFPVRDWQPTKYIAQAWRVVERIAQLGIQERFNNALIEACGFEEVAIYNSINGIQKDVKV